MGEGTGLLSAEVSMSSDILVPGTTGRLTLPEPLAIDAPQAVALLTRQAVKKGTDYRYEKVVAKDYVAMQCVNWVGAEDKREPSCIMGYVFHDLGLLDFIPQSGSVRGALSTLCRCNLLHTTPLASHVFGTAQRLQDMAWTWGEVVRHVSMIAQATLMDDVTLCEWYGVQFQDA